mgnify:CR=1 FL=1
MFKCRSDELFDFKCAGSRTCDAWIIGGPLTNEVK